MKVKVTQLRLTPYDPMNRVPARLLCPGDSPGKNNGVDSCSLLKDISLTQGSNWGLLHCRRVLYQLSYQGSLKTKYKFSIKNLT